VRGTELAEPEWPHRPGCCGCSSFGPGDARCALRSRRGEATRHEDGAESSDCRISPSIDQEARSSGFCRLPGASCGLLYTASELSYRLHKRCSLFQMEGAQRNELSASKKSPCSQSQWDCESLPIQPDRVHSAGRGPTELITFTLGFRLQIVSWGRTPGEGSSALTGAVATLVKASCRRSSLAVR